MTILRQLRKTNRITRIPYRISRPFPHTQHPTPNEFLEKIPRFPLRPVLIIHTDIVQIRRGRVPHETQPVFHGIAKSDKSVCDFMRYRNDDAEDLGEQLLHPDCFLGFVFEVSYELPRG